MRIYKLILFFLSLNPLFSFAQGQYTESAPIKSICPCETAHFFNNRQNVQAMRPFNFSSNCPQYVATFNNVSPEGFRFSHLFKKFKKKRKELYAKGSNIIRL
jgi:hypothetical protein